MPCVGLVQWRPLFRRTQGPRASVRWNGTRKPQIRFALSLCFGAVFSIDHFKLDHLSGMVNMRCRLGSSRCAFACPGDRVRQGTFRSCNQHMVTERFFIGQRG